MATEKKHALEATTSSSSKRVRVEPVERIFYLFVRVYDVKATDWVCDEEEEDDPDNKEGYESAQSEARAVVHNHIYKEIANKAMKTDPNPDEVPGVPEASKALDVVWTFHKGGYFLAHSQLHKKAIQYIVQKNWVDIVTKVGKYLQKNTTSAHGWEWDASFMVLESPSSKLKYIFIGMEHAWPVTPYAYWEDCWNEIDAEREEDEIEADGDYKGEDDGDEIEEDDD